MKAFFAALIVAIAVCVLSLGTVDASLCSTIQTARIIGRLCLFDNNKSNKTVVDNFFGCYDQAPGKEIFVKCQTSAFGGPLDNVEIVQKTCANLLPTPKYVKCLQTEFQTSEEMEDAVNQVNGCQSKVVGISSRTRIGCK